MRRTLRLALVCALLLAGVATVSTLVAHPAIAAGATATAKQGNRVLNDCQSHGQLTHTYSRAVLEKALSMVSADTAEYSNCSDVIHQALLHTIKTGGGGGGGSGATTIVIIVVVVVLLVLAALLAVLALRRRGRPGPTSGTP